MNKKNVKFLRQATSKVFNNPLHYCMVFDHNGQSWIAASNGYKLHMVPNDDGLAEGPWQIFSDGDALPPMESHLQPPALLPTVKWASSHCTKEVIDESPLVGRENETRLTFADSNYVDVITSDLAVICKQGKNFVMRGNNASRPLSITHYDAKGKEVCFGLLSPLNPRRLNEQPKQAKARKPTRKPKGNADFEKRHPNL